MKKEVKRNPDKPYEDMEGNWIGLGYKATKPSNRTEFVLKEDKKIIEDYLKVRRLQTIDGKKLRLEQLKSEQRVIEREIFDLEEEEAKKMEEERLSKIKLEEDNKEHLKRLIAIADYDEYPPKLKEPDSAIQKKHLRGSHMEYHETSSSKTT